VLKKTTLLLLLINSSLFCENIIDVSLDTTKQTHQSFLFNELMNDNNSTTNNYDNLEEDTTTSYINLNSNFNDIVGINLNKSLNGIDYSSYELYLGTNKIKYLSAKKISQDIEFDSNTLSTTSTDLTILGVINYTKYTTTSSKVEYINDEKYNALTTDVRALLPNRTPIIHRDFELEKFTISTENLYDITKEDTNDQKSYIKPAMFTKTFSNNISLYGVVILGYTQENYQTINNYFIDANGKKHNVTYNTKVNNGVIELNKDPNAIKDNMTFSGKYEGFEYGYKLTAQYKLKNKISFYLTAYQKRTKLKNKYKKDLSQTVISSSLNNTLIYDKLDYTKKYINLGVKYRF
jgi:hypothetical protein